MQKGFTSPLIVGIVAVFILGAFFAGIKYSENKSKSTDKPTEIQAQPTPAQNIETKENLIRRCGDIPDEAYPNYGHFDARKGPEWSSDCRYIAWSMWESGTAYTGNDPEVIKQLQAEPPRKLSRREGVFLYKDADKSVTKIYNPKELNETPEFIKWVDNQNLIFKTKLKEYNYNLVTKETTSVNQ